MARYARDQIISTDCVAIKHACWAKAGELHQVGSGAEVRTQTPLDPRPQQPSVGEELPTEMTKPYQLQLTTACVRQRLTAELSRGGTVYDTR